MTTERNNAARELLADRELLIRIDERTEQIRDVDIPAILRNGKERDNKLLNHEVRLGTIEAKVGLITKVLIAVSASGGGIAGALKLLGVY